jgi:hypothetical protein
LYPNRRRSRGVGRKIGRIVSGLILIGAGLFVLTNWAWIAGQVGAYVSPPSAQGAGITGSDYSGGYMSFVIWGFGFSLIGSGGAVLRSAARSSFAGAGGGGLAGGMGSPEMMNAYMERAMSATPRSVASSAPEVVRIKCRHCGSLEAEDATYCRKCGQAL